MLCPFNDNRVRQGFRLMINREGVIKVGSARSGNDLACPYDPDYARGREDSLKPDKAKFIIKAAGRRERSALHRRHRSGHAQYLESSIAQYPEKVGIKVTLDKAPARNLLHRQIHEGVLPVHELGPAALGTSQVAQAFNHGAPYNESHWEQADFDKLTNEARRHTRSQEASGSQLSRCSGMTVATSSGGFPQLIDGHSSKVHGFVPSSARTRWAGLRSRMSSFRVDSRASPHPLELLSVC